MRNVCFHFAALNATSNFIFSREFDLLLFYFTQKNQPRSIFLTINKLKEVSQKFKKMGSFQFVQFHLNDLVV